MAQNAPPSHAYLLTAMLVENEPPRHVIIAAGKNSEEAAAVYGLLLRRFDPFTTVIWYDGSPEMRKIMPFLEDYKTDRAFAAYVCENYTCRQPVFSAAELIESTLLTD
jgi:uncharacterized protein YyaL (SSP411 family)